MDRHALTLKGGARLAYYTAGDPSAPPLLFVHGWCSYHGVWRGAIEALCDRYFCVALDLLGFGDSDKPQDADYGIHAQGRRVLALADALGLERFALVGHSMGGQIALCIAATMAPARVARLVLVDGVVSGRIRVYLKYVGVPALRVVRRLPRLYMLVKRARHSRLLARRILFRPLFYDMNAMPYESWQIDRDVPFLPGVLNPSYQAVLSIINYDLTPHLSQVRAPLLVIFGDHDGMVPLEEGRRLAQAVSDSHLIVIKRCGHYPMYERPGIFQDALCQFLAEA